MKFSPMKILDPNGLVDNLYKYVQTKIEIAKVEVQERIEDIVKKIVLLVTLTLIGTVFLIFLLLTLALFLNKILESQYLGFLIVTVLLGIICVLVYMKIKPLVGSSKSVEKLEDIN